MIFLSPGMSHSKEPLLTPDGEKIKLSFSQFLSEEAESMRKLFLFRMDEKPGERQIPKVR
jgi:hypothetical protein